MKEVWAYRLVFADTVERLVDEINRELNEGWQPLGGAVWATHKNSDGTQHIHQTMVKYRS